MAKPRNKWRAGEAPTYYAPRALSARCTACGSPAAPNEAWCAHPRCLAERDRYRRDLAAFCAKYPETSDRLAAIQRGEAPEIHNTAREIAA